MTCSVMKSRSTYCAGATSAGRRSREAVGGARGVSPPPPPADIDGRSPRLATVLAGTNLHRFYTSAYDPIFHDRSMKVGSMRRTEATASCTPPKHVRGAFAETFLRTPGRRMIDPGLQARKAHVTIEVVRDLKLIEFDGPGLAILGATAEVIHGACHTVAPRPGPLPCTPTRRGWTEIAYSARHDPHETSTRCSTAPRRPSARTGATSTSTSTRTGSGSWPMSTPLLVRPEASDTRRGQRQCSRAEDRGRLRSISSSGRSARKIGPLLVCSRSSASGRDAVSDLHSRRPFVKSSQSDADPGRDAFGPCRPRVDGPARRSHASQRLRRL